MGVRKARSRRAPFILGLSYLSTPTAAKLICDMKTKPRWTGDGGEFKSAAPDPTLGSAAAAKEKHYPRQQREVVSLFFELVETADNFCRSLVAVMSGHPIIDSNRGLLARPNPSACLTTTICPAWLVRLAFRLSIRAALNAAQRQKHNLQVTYMLQPGGVPSPVCGRTTWPTRAFQMDGDMWMMQRLMIDYS